MTQHLQMWISIVALALTAINILWSWMVQSRSAAASKLHEVDCEVEAHDRRIQSLESEFRHLPTRQEIADLKVQMVEIVGQMRVCETEMQGAARTIRRVEDHLREARP